ncbi:sensor histidine kinase [Solimonas marina]|uniref:Histidine kinase n=1 Tax=Solimonas marina TaxID=2714601 RepID=A0A969W5U1_9GAMM|nr:histidine kinase [Solimonas marina]NKF20982.1 histidine kinase [Solimonas marina]
MPTSASTTKPRGLALAFDWRRLRFVLLFSGALGVLIGIGWNSGMFSAFIRVVGLGLCAMLAFSLFEQWPPRLPRWCARWVLQVLAVALTMPIVTFAIYVASTADGAPPFWADKERLSGFMMLAVLGVLLAPWAALAALIRQKEALARHQALSFALERSELERQAVDARLHLLQAQVAPHFLFNTLANVQALVDSGSSQASPLLRSLTAYLRAAVPRLHEPAATLARELELCRAYLALMHMRIPDRLQYSVRADESALSLVCPPMTVLTLVENAVRHGIDPSEEGGRIDVEVQRDGDRCRIRVVDTGIGLQASSSGLGTGLATLRERLRLRFGDDAQLRIVAHAPHGVCAQAEFAAREAGP